MVIEQETDFETCGSVATVEEALKVVENEDPDLVLSDLHLTGRNAIELIRELRKTRPALPVLVLSLHDAAIHAERVLRAGGRGFVPKEASLGVLLDAIRRVLDGGIFLGEASTGRDQGGIATESGAKQESDGSDWIRRGRAAW